MKAKRTGLAILLCLLTVAMAVLTSFAIFAAEAEPSVSIDRFNLSFNETIYIKYAVSFNGVDVTKLETQNRGMLFWTSPQESYTRENAESVTNELFYDSTISSYLYAYTKLAAKQMTDVIYARAYVVVDGETYYSEVEEYSILRYAYNKLGKSIGSTASTNQKLKDLLSSMLEYGAMAQSYFNYKADRPANADFVDVNVEGGVISETGMTSGLYLAGNEITLSASTQNVDGIAFSKWVNSANETVSTDATTMITVGSSNETYTAIYHTHSFGGWVQTKAPSCTEAGENTRMCSCGETETIEILSTGHTEVTDPAKAPTCTESGLTEGKHCSVCGDILVAQKTVSATGHDIENGACKNCDYEETVGETVNGITQLNLAHPTIGSGAYISGNKVIFPSDSDSSTWRKNILTNGTNGNITIYLEIAVTEDFFDEAEWKDLVSINGITLIKMGESGFKIGDSGYLNHEHASNGSKVSYITITIAPETGSATVFVDQPTWTDRTGIVELGTIGKSFTLQLGDIDASWTLNKISASQVFVEKEEIPTDLLEVGHISYPGWATGSYNEYVVSANGTENDIVIVFTPARNNWQVSGSNLLSINGVSVIKGGGAGAGSYTLGSTAVPANFNARPITVTINVKTGDATIVDTAGNTGTANVGSIQGSFILKINQDNNNSWELTSLTVTQESSDSTHTHSFGAWTETKAPTCTDEGEQTRKCSCGKTETEVISAKGHSFSNGVCTLCGEKYISNIYLDGVKISSVPQKGNYVVYVSDDEKDTRWNYTTWGVNEYSETATVYFFTVDKLYSSVDAMVADKSNLNYGDVVGTTSYYAGESRGAAIYKIINSYSSSSSKVYLSYGKYASLSPFTVGSEKVVSVDQFGAYANGTYSDVSAITNAISFADATVVEFEGEKYLQTSTIQLSNINNKTINGKGAYIYNNYSSVNWTDFNITNSSNLTVKNLELRCTETTGQGALYQNNDHVQLYVDNSSNIVFDNMIIYAPDNSSEDRHITSVWIHTGNNTVTLQNSTIKNLCNSTVGGAVWISGSDNVKILNNYIEKCSCDETIACFNGDCDTILIEGNYIYTHDEPESLTSSHVIGFSVNMTEELNCSYKNIIFRNNELDVVTQKDVFMFGNVDGVEIYNNKITARQNTTSQPIVSGIFRVPDADTTQSNVEIYGNDITLYNRYSLPISVNCTSGFTFTDNNYNFIAY